MADWGGSLGGAVSCSASSFTNCVFAENNSLGSGGAVSCSDSDFTGCAFTDNFSSCGGAVSGNNSTFVNCVFTSNRGVERNVYGNIISAGGAINGQELSFENCTFAGNKAIRGGAIFSDSSSFINCTFTLNEATEQGGAIWCDIPLAPQDPIILKNCILWGNTASEGSEIYEAEKPLLITYSNIQGGHAGTGNIDEDPLFINNDNDFHLQETSPCINTGTADGAPADDLDGHPRPAGGGFDMGAYEYQGSVVSRPPIISTFVATPAKGFTPLTVVFSCVAYDPDGGNIVEYRWDFNDDGSFDETSDDGTINHIYSACGVFAASCTVVDDDGDILKSSVIEITVDDSPDIEGDYNYYLPYYSSVNNYWTGLGLANLNHNEPAQLCVKVYDNNGNLLTTENKILKAYGQDAFPVAKQLNNSGWMWVNSHQPLSGLAFLGSGTTPSLMADIPFTSKLSSSLIIPHIAQNDVWDTTILLCNPNDESVSLVIKYIDKDGVEQGTQDFILDKNGSGEYLLSIIFSEQVPLEGRIEIVSAAGVAAFALYTDTKSGGNYYAGINAESCE